MYLVPPFFYLINDLWPWNKHFVRTIRVFITIFSLPIIFLSSCLVSDIAEGNGSQLRYLLNIENFWNKDEEGFTKAFRKTAPLRDVKNKLHSIVPSNIPNFGRTLPDNHMGPGAHFTSHMLLIDMCELFIAAPMELVLYKDTRDSTHYYHQCIVV